MGRFRSILDWLSSHLLNRDEAIKKRYIDEHRVDHRKWAGRQTSFLPLNRGWNAHPVDPNATFAFENDLLRLEIDCVADESDLDDDVQRFAFFFPSCWRYRFGAPNDEGWYYGQCRFTDVAPRWGAFYEVIGDSRLDCPDVNWTIRANEPVKNSRHFLFYFKDETFECDALDWSREPVSHSGAPHA